MKRSELIAEIKGKQSFLCIGLDTDLSRIPSHLLKEEDPIFAFNKAIIDATHDLCIAYKPNTAFYEAYGSKGWDSLQKTLEYIPKNILTIADAKRGDIGNTSAYYAKAFFENLNADALTVAPYMGADSVKPFLGFDGKWVILLALTSNEGSNDFQLLKDSDNQEFFKSVLEKSASWGSSDELMYVVGATRAEGIAEVRSLVPDYFFLVPGVGTQGGSLDDVVKYGWNKDCGLIVNSSRAIIYADNGFDFASAARREAKSIQLEMQRILENKGF
jgi:orotidine-5'-phosphate decarboxylase